jgi:hypothetical protein
MYLIHVLNTSIKEAGMFIHPYIGMWDAQWFGWNSRSNKLARKKRSFTEVILFPTIIFFLFLRVLCATCRSERARGCVCLFIHIFHFWNYSTDLDEISYWGSIQDVVVPLLDLHITLVSKRLPSTRSLKQRMSLTLWKVNSRVWET